MLQATLVTGTGLWDGRLMPFHPDGATSRVSGARVVMTSLDIRSAGSQGIGGWGSASAARASARDAGQELGSAE